MSAAAIALSFPAIERIARSPGSTRRDEKPHRCHQRCTCAVCASDGEPAAARQRDSRRATESAPWGGAFEAFVLRKCWRPFTVFVNPLINSNGCHRSSSAERLKSLRAQPGQKGCNEMRMLPSGFRPRHDARAKVRFVTARRERRLHPNCRSTSAVSRSRCVDQAMPANSTRSCIFSAPGTPWQATPMT